MHALSTHEGPIESNFNFIQNPLSMLCLVLRQNFSKLVIVWTEGKKLMILPTNNAVITRDKVTSLNLFTHDKRRTKCGVGTLSVIHSGQIRLRKSLKSWKNRTYSLKDSSKACYWSFKQWYCCSLKDWKGTFLRKEDKSLSKLKIWNPLFYRP